MVHEFSEKDNHHDLSLPASHQASAPPCTTNLSAAAVGSTFNALSDNLHRMLASEMLLHGPPEGGEWAAQSHSCHV